MFDNWPNACIAIANRLRPLLCRHGAVFYSVKVKQQVRIGWPREVGEKYDWLALLTWRTDGSVLLKLRVSRNSGLVGPSGPLRSSSDGSDSAKDSGTVSLTERFPSDLQSWIESAFRFCSYKYNLTLETHFNELVLLHTENTTMPQTLPDEANYKTMLPDVSKPDPVNIRRCEGSIQTMNDEFILLLQKRQASTSIGPSTARGMGPVGTISAAQEFLKKIDLTKFENINDQTAFSALLDSLTTEFKSALPKGGQNWGSARKFLNIFLRGVLYNRYLCERYDLVRFEPWLEVPLDSHVAKGLHEEEGYNILPRWKTVIGLSPKESKIFQDFAERVAKAKGTFRVHLDLLYWRGSHMTKPHGR